MLPATAEECLNCKWQVPASMRSEAEVSRRPQASSKGSAARGSRSAPQRRVAPRSDLPAFPDPAYEPPAQTQPREGYRIAGVVLLCLAGLAMVRTVLSLTDDNPFGDPSGLALSYAIGTWLAPVILAILGMWLWQRATPRPAARTTGSSTFENTSGMGQAATVPPEVPGWNWGALFLSWIWGIGNGVYIALLALVPFLSIVVPLILAAKGNEMAWRKKRWDSIEAFKATQRRWRNAGIAVAVVPTALILLAIPTFVSTIERRNAGNPTPRTLTSSDGSVSMTIPAGWREVVPDRANLAAETGDGTIGAGVKAEAIPIGAKLDLDELARVGSGALASSLGVTLNSAPQPLSVSGNAAVRYTTTGTIDGQAATVVHTSVMAPGQFLQIIIVGEEAAVRERWNEVAQLMDSVRPGVPPTPEGAAPPAAGDPREPVLPA